MHSTSFALETSQLGQDDFPEENFQLALDVMQDPKFLAMQGGWPLLELFMSDWDKLSDNQKDRLLEVIERIYPLFVDEMAWFMVTEILGEWFYNEQALAVLGRLAKSENEIARSVIAHGYEHVAKRSKDDNVVKSAVNALFQMHQDTSETVRCGAALSLGRLRDRGIVLPNSG